MATVLHIPELLEKIRSRLRSAPPSGFTAADIDDFFRRHPELPALFAQAAQLHNARTRHPRISARTEEAIRKAHAAHGDPRRYLPHFRNAAASALADLGYPAASVSVQRGGGKYRVRSGETFEDPITVQVRIDRFGDATSQAAPHADRETDAAIRSFYAAFTPPYPLHFSLSISEAAKEEIRRANGPDLETQHRHLAELFKSEADSGHRGTLRDHVYTTAELFELVESLPPVLAVFPLSDPFWNTRYLPLLVAVAEGDARGWGGRPFSALAARLSPAARNQIEHWRRLNERAGILTVAEEAEEARMQAALDTAGPWRKQAEELKKAGVAYRRNDRLAIQAEGPYGPFYLETIRDGRQQTHSRRHADRAGVVQEALEWLRELARVESWAAHPPNPEPAPPPPPSKPRKEVVPTPTNIFALREALSETTDGRIRRVPRVQYPHLRRMIDAGWLEPVPDEPRVWQLSDKGRAGLKEEAAKSRWNLPAWADPDEAPMAAMRYEA